MLMVGCASVTPRPEAQVNAPTQWRTAVADTVPVEPQWWALFGDPVLTTLVEQAMVNNNDVAIAAARIREARAQELVARSQLFPVVDAVLGASRSRSVSAFGTPVEATGVQPQIQVGYELDLFHRIDNQVEAARGSAMGVEAAHSAAQLSVAAATAAGYLTLRALDARLEIARTTASSRQEAVRIARARATSGYTSQMEMRQAEAELEATAALVPQLQLAVRRQENAINVLLGRAPEDVARGLLLGGIAAPPVPTALPSTLARRRPDIAQAEANIAAADASLAATRAQFLPQIRLSASGGSVFSTLLPNDPITIWSVGGSILAPLFNAGRTRDQVRGAESRRDQAIYSYRRSVVAAFREVEDALAAIDRLQAQHSRVAAQRQALAEVLHHARNRYEAGYSSYLEQLDAQRALLSSDLTLAQIQGERHSACVALYQALGGGWDQPDVQRAGPTVNRPSTKPGD
jgi:NodT family efflux transporter outer membrane factor (OMF) lipoprotein